MFKKIWLILTKRLSSIKSKNLKVFIGFTLSHLNKGTFKETYEAVKKEIGAKAKKLAGLSFVVSGTLSGLSRYEAKAKIRELGGDISESVSKKTDYVVTGGEPGSKFEKAKKLGVTTLTEKQFLEMIQK